MMKLASSSSFLILNVGVWFWLRSAAVVMSASAFNFNFNVALHKEHRKNINTNTNKDGKANRLKHHIDNQISPSPRISTQQYFSHSQCSVLFAKDGDGDGDGDSLGSRSRSRRSEMIVSQCNSAADALILLNEAKALRDEATELQKVLDDEKEYKIQKQREKVDRLIDALLFHGFNGNGGNNDNDESDAETVSVQLMQTEEQVAELFISKRLDYDTVNQMFDRIVEVSNRPQSIDSCSPLLSLLLDAADKVDCIDKQDNPNKRWNKRAQMDLRRKLFALGYGIRIEDVENERRQPRSITGDKDLY